LILGVRDDQRALRIDEDRRWTSEQGARVAMLTALVFW